MHPIYLLISLDRSEQGYYLKKFSLPHNNPARCGRRPNGGKSFFQKVLSGNPGSDDCPVSNTIYAVSALIQQPNGQRYSCGRNGPILHRTHTMSQKDTQDYDDRVNAQKIEVASIRIINVATFELRRWINIWHCAPIVVLCFIPQTDHQHTRTVTDRAVQRVF